ncbi:MAG: hypothetical protein NWS71_11465 [Opitutales bacterium]|jgi:hypothetical protein|nr:hypothetical protein [Opitutales bacterium]MDP4776915.1 hypothetical protein [Opitutales bacterium]MDP5079950.1 hypothetical protein [Opitutales bacterium]
MHPSTTANCPSAKSARYGSQLLLCVLFTLTSSLSLSSQTLESRSPFLPHDHKKPTRVEPPKAVAANGAIARQIEFRGIVQMNGVYKFSLFNKSDQKGYWIPEGESRDNIKITKFDVDSKTVTVSQNGRTEKLTLMESTDVPMAVATSAPPATANNATPNLPPGLTVQVNNNSKPTTTVPRRRVILPKKN